MVTTDTSRRLSRRKDSFRIDAVRKDPRVELHFSVLNWMSLDVGRADLAIPVGSQSLRSHGDAVM
jgi:hypothetical protein